MVWPPMLTIDRATAARFGITPATIDNALYDAFGQRIVSTIYTQSNQYRIILEADAGGAALARQPERALSAVLDGDDRDRCRSAAIVHVTTHRGAAGDQPSGAVSVYHHQLQSRTWRLAWGGCERHRRMPSSDLHLPDSFLTAFQGAAAAFQNALGNELYLVLAAVAAMYIVLGVLYESFAHPITILSTLPSAGIGALLALMAGGQRTLISSASLASCC